MTQRHRAREIALQILYRYDVAHTASGNPLPQGRELAHELIGHFEHFKVDAEIREFASDLVAGTLSSMTELDELLEKHASHWKVARMAVVDRCLLRMSAYELKKHQETPASVIIDEAVELAKSFGTTESPAFVNGILDAVQKSTRNSGSV